MRVKHLTAYLAELPLRKPFRHASFTRHSSTNLFIECTLTDGTTGWGEGVPREYVTGESPEGCIAQLKATHLADQLSRDCNSWSDVVDLADRFAPITHQNDPRGSGSNSLRAAVELSLLDAFGKLFCEPVSKVAAHVPVALDILSSSTTVRYSTTIDAEHSRKLWRSALKMRAWGFRQCKVKVGSDAAQDARRLRMVRGWIGPRVDLRIDVNEAWSPDDLVKRLEELEAICITCVEQPVAHEHLAELASLKPRLKTPVMLDESLTSMVDAERAIHLDVCDLFNLRISKCGGFLSCLRLAAIARRHGVGYQLGCHPGESGVLSAAGRHWATAVGEIRYLEGSYDHHVLGVLPTIEDITFGYGGRAPALTASGLGVTICRERFNPLVIAREDFSL